jgi:hypothetical protein
MPASVKPPAARIASTKGGRPDLPVPVEPAKNNDGTNMTQIGSDIP